MAVELPRAPSDEIESEKSGNKLGSTSVRHRVASNISISEGSESSLLQLPRPHPRFARKDFISQWVPEIEPCHPRARTFRTWHSRRDVVLWTCTGVALAVFLINLVSTIVFAVKYPPVNGIGAIFRGNRTQTSRLSAILHVLLNILSTLLLGASNMCMQLCVAPTREELDNAHRNNYWLDIGVPSLRNIKWISPRRQLLFVLLGLSSLPLHFLWNSAVFPSLVVNNYIWGLVHPNFLLGDATWDVNATVAAQNAQTNPLGAWGDVAYAPDIVKLHHLAVNNPQELDHLEPLECIQRYIDPFGARSDLLLVTVDLPMEDNNTLFALGLETGSDFQVTGNWICYWGFGASQKIPVQRERSCGRIGLGFFPGSNQEERRKSRQEVLSGWLVEDRRVHYCLASRARTENLYTVDYSLFIMIVVCVANLCKIICILLTALRYRKSRDLPLSIVGDAIASFLQMPDLSTRGLGACTKEDILRRDKSRETKPRKNNNIQKSNQLTSEWRSEGAKRWVKSNFRWFSGASRSRWYLSIGLCIIIISIALGFFISGICTAYRWVSIAAGFSVGFGVPDSGFLVDFLKVGPSATLLYKHVMFANFWQFAVSFFYILLNALLSSILVGSEWSHFAKHRKPLRVSAPEGIQRSSFFISMPYKFGVPLMSAVAVLHWAVSQAVFLVRVSAYYEDGTPDLLSSVSAVGYSLRAILASLVLAVLIVISIVFLGYKKYPSGMPMASTCSAAISAACHRPEDDFDAEHFPVMWGVVYEDTNGHQYCSFTTANDCRPIGAPVGWKEWARDEGQDETSTGREKSNVGRVKKTFPSVRALKEFFWRPIHRALHTKCGERGDGSESSSSTSDSSSSKSVTLPANVDEFDGSNIFISPWWETEASKNYEQERINRLNLERSEKDRRMESWKGRISSLPFRFSWHNFKQKLGLGKTEEETDRPKDA